MKTRGHSSAVDVTQMERDEFIAFFGGVFERSPWIAEAVWDEGINAADKERVHLHARMCRVLYAAPQARQDELISAHPELAAPGARKEALDEHSAHEQRQAGLDDADNREASELADLNHAYREKFGFPFVLAVAGRSRSDILSSLRKRLAGEYDDERQRALREICAIALHRLERLL